MQRNFSAAHKRWKSWSLPSRLSIYFGFVGGLAALFAIYAWMFPQHGPQLMAWVASIKPPTEILASRVLDAKRESIEYSLPSDRMFIARVITQPTLDKTEGEYAIRLFSKQLREPGFEFGKTFLIHSLSPLSFPAADKVFAGGQCSAQATVEQPDSVKLSATVRVWGLTCVDSSGKTYIHEGYAAGYASDESRHTDERVTLVQDGKSLTVPPVKLLVRLAKPTSSLLDLIDEKSTPRY